MSDVKIGLEIHGYLKTKSKMKLFADDIIVPEAEPNTTISPITTGLPGSKPMAPQREAVEKVFAIAALLGCKLNNPTIFYRKHYNWPDMPTGYQRTISGTYAVPPGTEGSFLDIGIEEVHLEEDPARWDPTTGGVDYNRSGYPLVEIVTKPDFTDAEQVRMWLKKLMTTLSYIDAIDTTLGIKADVNVSITPLFQRVEIKNVNSFSNIVAAIMFEIERQKQTISKGESVAQETRAWNEQTNTTEFMRSKEHAIDYAFIPEPDLPPLVLTTAQLQKIQATLPDTPEQKKEQFIARGVAEQDAIVLSDDFQLAGFFERVAQQIEPALAAKWLRRELMRVLHYQKKEWENVEVTPEHIITLLTLVQEKKITDTVAQKLLEKLVEQPFDIKEYVQQERLELVQDSSLLEKSCQEVIEEEKQAVGDFKTGEEKALHFLVGQVMRKTRGAASPDEVIVLMKKMLK